MYRFFLAASVVLGILVASIASATIPGNPATSSAAPTSSGITPAVPAQLIPTFIPPAASPEASVTRIFSYNGGGFENLALRSNGQILATLAFPAPLLFYIDPLQIRPGVILQNFTSLKNTVGITELAPDMFYVHGQGTDGVFAVYSVDMRDFVVLPNGTISTPPRIKKIGSIPSALLLNGMTRLRRSDNFVLVADTLLGGVWRFNIDTGKSDLVIHDPSMAGPANKTDFAAFGINGIRTQNGTLFYCNSGAQSFYKMPVSLLPTTNNPHCPSTFVASGKRNPH
jgi:hypothetical protein